MDKLWYIHAINTTQQCKGVTTNGFNNMNETQMLMLREIARIETTLKLIPLT